MCYNLYIFQTINTLLEVHSGTYRGQKVATGTMAKGTKAAGEKKRTINKGFRHCCIIYSSCWLNRYNDFVNFNREQFLR